MATSRSSLISFAFSADSTCPGSPYPCPPPSAYAHDPDTGRFFCCDPLSVCYNAPATCSSDGSTFKCNEGTKDEWCCASDAEACSGSSGQFNVCWSKAPNLLGDVGIPSLNKTYSSLIKKDPDASSWAFDPAVLIAATATTSSQSHSSTPSSTDSSAGPTTTGDDTAAPTTTADNTSAPTTTPAADTAGGSSSTPSSTPSSSSHKSLSSGAIAGIVIGAVAGVLLIALAVFLLRRRRRRREGRQAGVPWVPQKPELAMAQEMPGGDKRNAHELGGGEKVAELPGDGGYR